MNGSTEFTKAKTFLEGGGSIADIEKKYKLSAEVKSLLK